MKKLLILAAVASVFALSSCQKSAADYAKELTQLEAEYVSLVKEGKMEEADNVRAKAVELTKEIQEKMMKDPKFAEECLKLKSSDILE